MGSEAQQYPDIIKEESDLGNEVASHTWDHKDLVTLSPAQQKQEIESANQLINKITGKMSRSLDHHSEVTIILYCAKLI